MKPAHEWTDQGADLWIVKIGRYECSVEWSTFEGYDFFVTLTSAMEGGEADSVASGHVISTRDDASARQFAMWLAEQCVSWRHWKEPAQ